MRAYRTVLRRIVFKMVGLRCIPLHMMCLCYLAFSGIILLVLFLAFHSVDTDETMYYYDYDEARQPQEKNEQDDAMPFQPALEPNNPDADNNIRDKVIEWIEEMHPKKSNRVWDTIAVNCNEVNISSIALTDKMMKDCHPLQRLFPDIRVCLPPEKWTPRDDWDSMFLITVFTLMQMFPKLGLIDVNAEVGAFSLLAASLKRNAIAIEPDKMLVDSIGRSVLANKDAIEHVTLLHNVLVQEEEFTGTANGTTPKPSLPTIVMSDLLEVVPFSYAILRLDILHAEHKALMQGADFLERVTIPFILVDWQDLRANYKADIPEFMNFLTDLSYEPFKIFLTDDESKVDAEKLNLDEWTLWPDRMLWKNNFQ